MYRTPSNFTIEPLSVSLIQYQPGSKKIVAGRTGKNRIFHQLVELGTLGGGWTKIVLRGDLRVLSGVRGGFEHSGRGLDVS
jgi:hypothetical protein